ncbi:DUF1236 domain-containing protein [Starkeya sp. ORNL1]|uniref:DUF1236 domain-containing protein n=1 Tax=Starkeya sp. ORNL1 TaxID=2709380 RepID=UPI001463883B|nr:DUF1236 domain-containing protein [Starkeya sp. ORNL1]QJP12599.1 DUF1236 domain-containing protein [Starkeya sp. ORNL1]
MYKLLYAALVAGVVTAPSSAFSQAAIVTTPSEVGSGEVQPSATIEREVLAGPGVPDAAELHTLPTQSDAYTYTVVNNRRVVIETKTGKVVSVMKATD